MVDQWSFPLILNKPVEKLLFSNVFNAGDLILSVVKESDLLNENSKAPASISVKYFQLVQAYKQCTHLSNIRGHTKRTHIASSTSSKIKEERANR